MGGLAEIDVEDWKRNTLYKDYISTDLPVVWFWKVQTCVSLFMHICIYNVFVCVCVVAVFKWFVLSVISWDTEGYCHLIDSYNI